ncbi:MAG TPA: glycoside hydrolase family 28 protein, partial [Chitinophagaceae bacterium]|nr:glycoside hydrolase family 28 protein [Chitinophagaceae bacterium]
MKFIVFSVFSALVSMNVWANDPEPILPKVIAPLFKKDTFNILKFGGKPDGITLNTTNINSAIDACNKKGGGVVLIPAGLWLTGPIVLKSNVNLHLQKNALLQFSSDFNQYKLVEGNWEGLPQMRNQSPISATGAENIAITGYGIIDGAGEAWRMVKKDKLTEAQWKKLLSSGGLLSDDKKTWYPTGKFVKGNGIKNAGVISPEKTPEYYDSIKDFLRPNLLVLTRCKRILLEGVTFQNSPAWCLHPLMSEHITVRNLTVLNPWYAQNGDGLDLESCKNVLIENSRFDVGDDGICIKSGRDEAGRQRAMPTENVLVKNCVVYHAHGGFVIGSEMSGGAKNIIVEDCTFIGTDIGLRFKTTRGRGGIVENIFIKNISMKNIPGEAILFDMYYAAQDPIPLPGEERKPPVV